MAKIMSGANNTSIQDRLYSYDQRAVEDYWRRSEGRRSQYSEMFRNKVRSTYESVRGTRLFSLTLASVRKIRNMGKPDGVSILSDVGSMQHARPTMQRLIMADPRMLRLYRRRQIEGWSGSWADVNSNAIGDTDQTYRQLYDGIAVKSDDRLVVTNYVMSQKAKDEFTDIERSEARITAAYVMSIIERGDEDPTSVWNAGLSRL